MQMNAGRLNLEQLCAAVGIADSNHLPRTFRSLLPCAATLPGAVTLMPDIVRHHSVDHALWQALGPFIMRLARGDVTVAALWGDDAFLAAKQRWINTSGVTNSKIKSEEEKAAQAVQVCSAASGHLLEICVTRQHAHAIDLGDLVCAVLWLRVVM